MNLYGHRRERFVVELLDLNDAILGTLDPDGRKTI